MSGPVLKARTLVTEDGVPIDAIHLPGDRELAIVLAHGFTLSWQRPAVWRVATRLSRSAGVITFDFRGHGRSGGLSTMGDREIRDLDVAVAYARELGYRRVAAVGFSMGASIVVRYAGLVGGLDAAVSVSGPGRWYYRGTKPMRRVHWAVERRAGRLVTRTWLKTRVSPVGWNPVPVPPAEAAAQITPIPFLVVHGDQDLYFPVEHAHQLYEAAREPKELWILAGFGHAESGMTGSLADRIARWVQQAAWSGTVPAQPDQSAEPASPEPATPERATAERATAERATAERASSERASARLMPSMPEQSGQLEQPEQPVEAGPYMMPADDVDVDEAAVDGVGVDDAAVDGVGVDEAAVDGVGLNGVAVNGVAVESMAVEGMVVEGLAVEGVPAGDMPVEPEDVVEAE